MSEAQTPRNGADGSFPITVLLVDDQPIIHESVRRMLEGEPDITLHACADPTEALELADRVAPTVILQDLVMPEVDGLTLVKYFRVNPSTRQTPMIVLSSKEEPVVKAEAFARGANDYLVKLPDRVELVARIRHHSRGYISLLERNQAYAVVDRQRQQLAEQLDAAARFVHGLLPAPLKKGPIRTAWKYVPSADLGGDTFGYEWLDPDHFALYLLDVTGHGLASALFSVTIMNVLRSRSLPNADFLEPGRVLAALSDAFPMDLYGDKFFTMWYGVYDRPRATLRWSGGGHPPALLFAGDAPPGSPAVHLGSVGPMLGMMPGLEFETAERPILPGSRLYVYSDGVQEIHKADGSLWSFKEFEEFMARPGEGSVLDRLLSHARELHGSDVLEDDFSLLEACF